jgi:hypothetical protein
MALLIKDIVEELTYLTESNEKGEKNYFIEGIIMQGDIKNRNGRIYPSNVLIREMNRYNDNYVAKNRAFGELGHPQGPTINLDRVSHMFTELKADGANVIGKAKITKTPMGDVVKGLIDSGAQLGISSRGMGSVKPNKQGIMEVQNDFMLATAGDIVADPSAPDAFVKGIMEGVEWIYDVASSSWRAANTFDQIEEQVKKNYSQIDEAAAIAVFQKFLKSL